MGVTDNMAPVRHGHASVRVTRYLALYLAQAGWLLFGAYLANKAYWPSSCQPDTVVKVLSCSARLAEQRGWIETALMVWLWSTPLLAALEVSRWIDKRRAH